MYVMLNHNKVLKLVRNINYCTKYSIYYPHTVLAYWLLDQIVNIEVLYVSLFCGKVQR